MCAYTLSFEILELLAKDVLQLIHQQRLANRVVGGTSNKGNGSLFYQTESSGYNISASV
jgi:hypothetical protein